MRNKAIKQWANPEIRIKMTERLNDPIVLFKKHETMKKNGTYGKKTLPENMLYDELIRLYGVDDIEEQVFVHKWPIDFYVKSIDAYIQMDGDYWHGLDRPIGVIEEIKTPRDAVILKKMKTDKEQVAWFNENGMRIVRIPERCVKIGDFSMLHDFVKSLHLETGSNNG